MVNMLNWTAYEQSRVNFRHFIHNKIYYTQPSCTLCNIKSLIDVNNNNRNSVTTTRTQTYTHKTVCIFRIVKIMQ